ncbi:MAG: hypothetical protein LBV38_04295 [Alistipes sp.]|nr:hypothetical protein [Alistipes sp.]
MNYSESIFDRYMFTTDTNEYATGLNDENEWEENLMDYDVSLDDESDDFLEGTYSSRDSYNETGYSPSRIN